MDNEFRTAILSAIGRSEPDNTSAFSYNGDNYLIKYISSVDGEDSEIHMYWLYKNGRGLYQLHIDSNNEIAIALDLAPFNITLPSQQGGARRKARHSRRRRRTTRRHK